MVTIIMFLIFSKANFFLASLMIGGGVVADIFIYRFLVKPMLQKKGDSRIQGGSQGHRRF